MSFLQVDIAAFKARVAELLAAYPELTEDEQLREDMIVGETEIESIVKRLVKIRTEASAMAAAVKQIKQDNAERQARFERKADGASALLKSLLLAADLDKVTLPEATVSVIKPRTKVNVLDVNELPQGTFRVVREPDKKALMEMLSAGEEVPGAELVLGEETISVRTK